MPDISTLKSVGLGIISSLITPLVPAVITIVVGYEKYIENFDAATVGFIVFILALFLYVWANNFKRNEKMNMSIVKKRIIQQHDTQEVYILNGLNKLQLIPDGETFYYLGSVFSFTAKDIEKVTKEEINRYGRFSDLPSIRNRQ